MLSVIVFIKAMTVFLETLFSFLDPKATSFEELYSGTFSSFIHFLLDDEYASVPLIDRNAVFLGKLCH